MNEAGLRTRIVKSLNAYGGYWFVTHADGYTQVGLPDILGVYHGYFFAFEVKLPGKQHTLKPWQSRMLDRINKSGGRALMVTSVSEAMDFVFKPL
jgi:penicillin-binding protein-related factor A (putative recombinase)